MIDKKTHRLYQVVKELKEKAVTSEDIIAHLQKKGQNIQNDDMNTKLTNEQYELVLEKYAPEKLKQIKLSEGQNNAGEEDKVEAVVQNPTVDKEANEKKLLQQKIKQPIVKNQVPATNLEALRNKPVAKPIPQKPIVPQVESQENKNLLETKIVAEVTNPQLEVSPKTIEKPVVKTVDITENKLVVSPDAPQDENLDVIRADENAGKLKGLTVLGKINIEKKSPAGKDKKRENFRDRDKRQGGNNNQPVNKPVSEPQKDKDGKIIPPTTVEGEEAKQKRKRKRKRKKTGTETTPNVTQTQGQNTNNNANANRNNAKNAPKKEKISDKDVKDSMRKTLQEMDKGAERVRQRSRRSKRDEALRRKEERDQQDQEESRILRLTEFITANEFADLIGAPVTEIITKCFQLGMMISINMRLDAEVLALLAEEYDYEIEFVDVREEELEGEEEINNPEDNVKRNPVITVMGHVDHGKTTLLDYLRKANVAESEAGGITQHIGAYQVKLKTGDKVTFLDTPGHEAFTAMRARGTKVTDVAIIVIAADDAVMPTTKEAISHAQAANVKMVFAINKIDKPGADPDRIRTQLSQMNILVEDWGGTYQCQEISAKFGKNVDELLEKVILESEILDLKANPHLHANGSVIESRLSKGYGNVATLLVQDGTLRVGDGLVAGIYYGKVRALINQKGERIKEAGPSTPVQVLGLAGLPTAGDRFQVYAEESKAKEVAQKRQELYREQQLRQTKRITLEEIGRRKTLGNFKELNIVIKGDVDGSVEALAGALLKLSTEEVAVNIIHKGTGAITEGDILLAAASDALIIAFNVRPNGKAKDLAEKEAVNIRTYSIIYNAIDDVTQALEGLLEPDFTEEIMGTIEVREVFRITKVGQVAGCYVTSGKVYRQDPIRVIRDGVVLADTKIATLKRFKDDVRDVAYGFECGLQVHNFGDIQVGDVIESYRVSEVKRKL